MQVAAIPATDGCKAAAWYASKKKKMRAKYKLNTRINAVMQHGDGSESALAALDLKCAALITTASLAGHKTLTRLAPATAKAIVAINQQSDDRIKLMSSLLPKRSRFRASMVRQLGHNKPDAWVSEVFNVDRTYRKTMFASQSVSSTSPLQIEQMRGPREGLAREAVSPAEISLVCDWAKSKMIVKSGTRRETFKLEAQKQTLLEQFRAASPRIFRQLVKRDPTLRALSSRPGNMTILQRNIERALWIEQQDGFTEGDEADAKELTVTDTHTHTASASARASHRSARKREREIATERERER